MSLFLRALRGEDTPRAPIWIMRQAGRYLSEYRALKAQHGFWTLARTPELAAEVTLQPVRRFGMDAAILFSDIMTPLPDMGLELEFKPGPVLERPVRSAADVARLRVPSEDEVAPFVPDAIRLLRRELGDTPLIGFAGAPLTLATYAVQGQGSKEYEEFRAFLRRDPETADELLEKFTATTINYLRAQVAAGAQAVQLFDSWAGIHDLATYRRFGAPAARRVLDALADTGVPRLYIAVGAQHLYPAIAELPLEGVSVDWRMPLSACRSALPGRTLQGNLDPAALLGDAHSLEREATAVLRDGLGGPHVFNLGHGIFKETDPDMVARLVRLVQGFERHAHDVEAPVPARDVA
ncbi:uroporphyrinogen decarboxylase [soil metagenome]